MKIWRKFLFVTDSNDDAASKMEQLLNGIGAEPKDVIVIAAIRLPGTTLLHEIHTLIRATWDGPKTTA